MCLSLYVSHKCDSSVLYNFFIGIIIITSLFFLPFFSWSICILHVRLSNNTEPTHGQVDIVKMKSTHKPFRFISTTTRKKYNTVWFGPQEKWKGQEKAGEQSDRRPTKKRYNAMHANPKDIICSRYITYPSIKSCIFI